MSAATVLILAAGQGTRMRSRTPKMLHELCGRPLIAWPLNAARISGAGRIVLVTGPGDALDGVMGADVLRVVQTEPRGTGHAVMAAAKLIDRDTPLVVLAGDVPLVDAQLIDALLEAHAASAAAATMVTMVLDDPTGYGRVVRDGVGDVERVVETKTPGDATAAELRIAEVNSGIFAFDGGALRDALSQLSPENRQREYYLPDVLASMRAAGLRVRALEVKDAGLLLGVNDRAGLALARGEAQRRIHERLMLAGVTIVEPASTSIDVDVVVQADARIEPCTQLRGATRIAAGAVIGPHSTLIDAVVGADSRVIHSHLEGCEVRDRVSVGPFAYLRPGTLLRDGSKAGTFVEIKNSDVGEQAKVPHLSYVGDADIGERANLGAGSITANYDGRSKHRTTIGADVRGGVDTAYVAPVTVGDRAWTAAGSVVSSDVPPGALAVARARQRNIEGWADRPIAP